MTGRLTFTPTCLRAAAWPGLLAALLAGAPVRAQQEGAERIVIPTERFRASESAAADAPDESALGSGRRFNYEGFRAEMLGVWFKRKIFLHKGLAEAAAAETDELEQLCRDTGVTRLDEISAALIHEGNAFLDEGNFEKARCSFRDALRFNQHSPEAHFRLASTDWRSGASLGGAVKETVAGLKATWRSYALSSAALGNILILALLSAAATAVLFSLAMLVRYQVLVRHDLEETVQARHPGRLPREGLHLVGWGLVLLPLLTWIAALWTPAYWIALTFRYQKARERAISAALLALLILSTPVARAAELLFGLASDPGSRLMLTASSGSYDPAQIVALEQVAVANPGDAAYPFLLAGLYARGRYLAEADAHYRRTLEIDPGHYRAWNNLGNLYLTAGRPEEALKHYKSALAIRGEYMPALYNSYLARKELLELKEAEQSLAEAQRVDPDAMSALMSRSEVEGSGEPIDASIEREEIFARIVGARGGTGQVFASLLSLPSIMATLFLLAALGLSVMAGARQANRCVRCGEPFCHRCKVGDRVPDYCSPCQHIATAKEGLSPSIRREKITQSERFRAAQIRLGRILSVPVPGMGRILDGRTLTGGLIVAAWSASLLALALRPHLLQPPAGGPPRPWIVMTILLALAAACAWILGNVRASREANAPAGAWQWH